MIEAHYATHSISGHNASSGFQVTKRKVLFNTGSGIKASSNCQVQDNFCRSNGSGTTEGAGIHVLANASRSIVMNNTCSGSDFGIKVEGMGNLVKGNTCTSNTSNFEIVACNRVTVMPCP